MRSIALVVPFAGSRSELERLFAELRRLRLGPGDEVIVADNRRRSGRASCGARGRVRVCAAAGLRSPAFARNRGAEIARGEWLVFIDADTTPASSLLDDYFEPAPDRPTAVLAGGILDVAERATLAARHSAARGQMSDRATLERLHLRNRPGWAWMRVVRRYDDYERTVEQLPSEPSAVPADEREPAGVRRRAVVHVAQTVI